MDYRILSAPLDKVEYLFFTATFKHRTTFYKIAVAEKFTYHESAFRGHYGVLMQSELGTHYYDLYKDESNEWQCDNNHLQNELVFLIGSQIDQIKE